MSRNYLEEHLERVKERGRQYERLLKEMAENEQIRRQFERQNVLPAIVLKEWREELA